MVNLVLRDLKDNLDLKGLQVQQDSLDQLEPEVTLEQEVLKDKRETRDLLVRLASGDQQVLLERVVLVVLLVMLVQKVMLVQQVTQELKANRDPEALQELKALQD